MKKLIRGLMVVAIAAVVAVPASAQTPVTMRLQSANPYGTVTGFGAYVGPYRGIMVSEPGSPTIDIFCVDYNNHISVGQTWNSNFWALVGDISGTRFAGLLGVAAAQQRYRQAAWLASMFSTSNQNQWGNIHAAIWRTMTCPTAGGCAPGTNATVNALYNAAGNEDNWSTVNLAEWVVVTDRNTVNGVGGVQEYLTRTVVPEPGTILLFGTGLVLVGFVAWRRTLG